MKKLSLEEVVDRIRAVHGDEVFIYPSTYINIRKKAKFFDKIHGGEFETRPITVFKGSRHTDFNKQERIKKLTLNIKNVLERIWSKHGDVVKLDTNTYKNSQSKARFIDKDYGEWWTVVKSVMRGHEHPDRAYKKIDRKKSSIEKIEKQIYEVHGNIVRIIPETFKGLKHSAIFVDMLHGEWKALPSSVIYQSAGHPNRTKTKREGSYNSKYGVSHPAKVSEIALKGAINGNNSCKKNHWKTGEILICKASWEPRVVDYLNAKKINFKWQPKTFNVPMDIATTLSGKQTTYRPDLYLSDQCIWVEIKGYFREESKKKWDWFKSEYPTSELWDQKKLKEMGIL